MMCAAVLALLIDVSYSARETYELQRNQTADAFRHAIVTQTISPELPVAVGVIYWNDTQETVVDWTLIGSHASADAFAEELRSVPRPAGMYTFTGEALHYGLDFMERAPCDSHRRMIDISTDGISNGDLSQLRTARERAENAGVTINAITITNEAYDRSVQFGTATPLPDYARDNIVTSDGRVFGAASWAEFARVIRQKIVFEVSSYIPR